MPVASLLLPMQNRGIGKAICESIIRSSQPVTIYATTRNSNQLEFLKSPRADCKIVCCELDVQDSSSIHGLAARVRRECGGEDGGACDVLINNAGVLHQSFTSENARQSFAVHYYGVLEISQAFAPLLRAGGRRGRIVMISSEAGELHCYSREIQRRFRDPHLDLDKLDALIKDYTDSGTKGTLSQDGWPEDPYTASKAAETALTGILARENPDLFVNCCCPGWVRSEMGNAWSPGIVAPKSIDDGAKIPLRLAFGDIGGLSGKYWKNSSNSSASEGKVYSW